MADNDRQPRTQAEGPDRDMLRKSRRGSETSSLTADLTDTAPGDGHGHEKHAEPGPSDDSESRLDDLEAHQTRSHSPVTGTLEPQLSRHASAFTSNGCVVPRSDRRGLLARFAIIPEVQVPYEYNNGTKWAITAIVALAAAAAPMGSGILYRELRLFTLLAGYLATSAHLRHSNAPSTLG